MKAYDVVVLNVDAMVRRVEGGIMSRKAEMRSQIVSSCKARPRSDTSESSEKSDCNVGTIGKIKEKRWGKQHVQNGPIAEGHGRRW